MDKDAEKSDFPLLALSPTSLPVMGGSGNRDWNIALDTTQTLQWRTENNIKLDPGGSTVHYEMMKLGQFRTLCGGSSC